MLDFAPRRSSGTELSGSHRTGYRIGERHRLSVLRALEQVAGDQERAVDRRRASMCRCFRCGCRRLPRAAHSDTSSRSANGLIFFRTGSKRWPRSLKRSRTPLFSLTRARSWRRPIVRQRPSVKRCRNVRQPEDRHRPLQSSRQAARNSRRYARCSRVISAQSPECSSSKPPAKHAARTNFASGSRAACRHQPIAPLSSARYASSSARLKIRTFKRFAPGPPGSPATPCRASPASTGRVRRLHRARRVSH